MRFTPPPIQWILERIFSRVRRTEHKANHPPPYTFMSCKGINLLILRTQLIDIFLCCNSPARTQAASFFRVIHHTQLDTSAHALQDSSERVINSSQRPLPSQRTTNTRDQISRFQRNSKKTHSQESCGFTPTPQNSRPPVFAIEHIPSCILYIFNN